MKTRNQILSLAVAMGSLALTATSAQAAFEGQLGILDEAWFAANPINPDTGLAWQAGDTYHLAFSTEGTVIQVAHPARAPADAMWTDITNWDAVVQTEANTAGIGATEGVTWKIIGSTSTVNARDHAVVSGPVYTCVGNPIASNYADMWDGAVANPITHIDGTPVGPESYASLVLTGSNSDGTKSTNPLGDTDTFCTWGNPGFSDVPGNHPQWMMHTFPNQDMNRAGSLYGLSEPLTVVGDPEPATITSFEGAGATGVINQAAKTIALEVPFGTALATLAPTFTLFSGTCDQTSGAIPLPTFAAQNPVDYVVTDTSTDPDTVNTYEVTVTVAPEPPVFATLVIDLGTSPAGTTIEGGSFGTYVAAPGFPTNLPLPSLPAGSILQSIAVAIDLESTNNENFTNDLAVLVDPTPGTPGGDFSLGIISPEADVDFGLGETLTWVVGGDENAMTDTKTDADWTGDIDLATNGLFLGNAFGGPTTGGTWSGTITLTYVVGSGGGNSFGTWIAGFNVDGQTGIGDDPDGDGVDSGVENFFGTAPDEFTQGLVSDTADTGAGTFTFTHPQTGTIADDLTAGYRWSTDLATFNADGATDGAGTKVDFTVDLDTPDPGTTTVTATVTAGPVPDKMFFDVEVTQN